MPGKRKSAHTKDTAIALAAGSSAAAAAAQLGLNPRSVQTWVAQTDPTVLAAFIAEKRSRIAAVVFEYTEQATRSIMTAIIEAGDDPLKAKAVQARATAFGIMVDKATGQNFQGNGGRFGGATPAELSPLLDERRTLILEQVRRSPAISTADTSHPEVEG